MAHHVSFYEVPSSRRHTHLPYRTICDFIISTFGGMPSSGAALSRVRPISVIVQCMVWSYLKGSVRVIFSVAECERLLLR